MSAHLERLKAEEAELEAQMLGDQASEPQDLAGPAGDDDSTTGEEGIVATPEELEASSVIEEIIVQPSDDQGLGVESEDLEDGTSDDDEQLDGQPQKPQRTNWKKRFIGLQKHNEAVQHAHKREVLELNERINELEKTLYDLRMAKPEVQGDVFDGVFTQEDEDTFGSEGLEILKKAAKAGMDKQLKPLQDELRRQEQARLEENKRRTAAQRQSDYQKFLDKLEIMVPEYAELNVDKGFLSWMSEADDISGAPRADLFRKAESAGDVLRVADFFMQYKDAKKPKDPSLSKEVQRHVTPVGSGGGSTTPARQTKQTTYYRESDINKFYSDVLKGRYDGKRAIVDATEDAIQLAHLEGRILRGQ